MLLILPEYSIAEVGGRSFLLAKRDNVLEIPDFNTVKI